MEKKLVMRDACLHTGNGGTIRLKAAFFSGRILFECYEPSTLLSYLTKGQFAGSLSPDTYLCGVVIPGEGAFIELRDQFGSLAHDVIKMNDAQANELLIDRIW